MLFRSYNKTTTFPSLGTQDFIFAGNIGNWKKFAYGLKARYTMRLAVKEPKYAEVVSFANQSFTSGAEQAQLVYNGSTTVSPFYKFYTDRDYFGASQSLYNKLGEREDPRIEVFWKAHPSSGEFLLAPNGVPDQVQATYSISAISNATAPTYLMRPISFGPSFR